jgi:hypothetical protein
MNRHAPTHDRLSRAATGQCLQRMSGRAETACESMHEALPRLAGYRHHAPTLKRLRITVKLTHTWRQNSEFSTWRR